MVAGRYFTFLQYILFQLGQARFKMRFHLNLVEVFLASAALSLLLSRYNAGSFTYYFAWSSPSCLAVYVLIWSWIYPFYLSPLKHIPTVPGFPLWGHFREIVTEEVGVPQRVSNDCQSTALDVTLKHLLTLALFIAGMAREVWFYH